MKIVCYKCDFEFERTGSVNIYGTFCPNCSNRILPVKEPAFIQEKKMKKKILQEEALEKLREKIRRNRQ